MKANDIILAVLVMGAVYLVAKSGGGATAGRAITDSVMRPSVPASQRNPLNAAPMGTPDMYNILSGVDWGVFSAPDVSQGAAGTSWTQNGTTYWSV